MSDEFNDLTTDNIALSFNNNPNNLELSDELEAHPVYTEKMGTRYSLSKWISRGIVGVGLIITVTAASILSGNVFSNVFVSNPPVLSDEDTSFIVELRTFVYTFTIASNPNNYPITFMVYRDIDNPVAKIDCTDPNYYYGRIENLDLNREYRYDISFSNRVDYKRSLISGTFITNVEV